jgi:hypothetical protein
MCLALGEHAVALIFGTLAWAQDRLVRGAEQRKLRVDYDS